MAYLEYIRYVPHRLEIDGQTVSWVAQTTIRTFDQLPQVFWDNGEPWQEVNLWALEMARNRDVKLRTVQSLVEHIHKYANWLEQVQVDWRHFPQEKAERVLVRYRGELIDARDRGDLKPSTTTSRMRSVIRFYRYAADRNFINRDAPKWQDKVVVVKYFDTAGFERAMQRIATDISIPNRARPGLRLEDGLLPLTEQHMTDMLRFAKENAPEELYLMLSTGCFTGTRISTITTLRVSALEKAMRDPKVPGMWVVPVGPGTGISTKFDVSGDLMIPDALMIALKAYATSPRHLKRVIMAANEHKNYLFLTRHNKPYRVSAVDRMMVDFRRSGQASGLKFMQNLKFHQTRATYGTWLMTICLKAATVKAAIEFVRRAMHHKHEATTFGYITFIEHTRAKIEVSNAFTEAFLGLNTRLSGEPNA